MNIRIGGLYCVSDSYFERFRACEWVMRNHTEGRSDGLGFRPYVIAIRDSKNKGILWAVPLAHDAEKYRAVYDRRVAKSGFCDNIGFARIAGNNTASAVLAQNMVPVTEEYIESPYRFLSSGKPRGLSRDDERAVLSMARKTLAKHRQGIGTIHPPVDSIYESLGAESMIARGIEALKAAPLATGYVLVKETASAKTTVAVLGGQGGSLDDLRLVRIDERPGKEPFRKVTPITAPHFARKVGELSSVQWTKAVPRRERLFPEDAGKPDRAGFEDALDRAEKAAEESAARVSRQRPEKSRPDQSRGSDGQR